MRFAIQFNVTVLKIQYCSDIRLPIKMHIKRAKNCMLVQTIKNVHVKKITHAGISLIHLPIVISM